MRASSMLVDVFTETKPYLSQAVVQRKLAGNRWQVADSGGFSFAVSRAYDCLAVPEVDDVVLLCCMFADDARAENALILHILQRESGVKEDAIVLNPGGERRIDVEAQAINWRARDRIGLYSGGEVDLVCRRNLNIAAKNLMANIAQACVHLAKQFLVKAEQVSQTASQVWMSQAKIHLMNAEDDIKIDAKRINMG